MHLIIASNGQLGSSLSKIMPNAMKLSSSQLDIRDREATKDFFAKNNFECIFNCAAYTAVDKAEDEADLAREVNELALSNLIESGAKIIHVSTDYVFDGTNHCPYLEDDKANPQSVYGKTKLGGEKLLMSKAESVAIIRTSWVYSEYGNNFVKTMMNLGTSRESLNVICDQIGTPTYAMDLAKAMVEVANQMEDGTKEIYNFSNEGVASWYDFAKKIMELKGIDCKINPIYSKDYPQKAKRPHFSVLNKTKIKNKFNIKINHWEESLKECLNQF